MNHDLLERHLQEWETFAVHRKQALDQQAQNEHNVRSRYRDTSGKLNDTGRDLLQWQRTQWQEEWGAKGTRAKELQDRHHLQEQAQATASEMDDDLRFPAVTTKRDEEAFAAFTSSRGYRPERPNDAEMQEMFELSRNGAWRELAEEQEAITAFYENKDMPVPEATGKRMNKHFAAFKSEWDGIETDPDWRNWKILEEEDLQHDIQNWSDLQQARVVTEQHYGGQDKLPHTARQRMASDEKEYWQELEAYREEQKIAAQPELELPPSEPQTQREAFKDQLEAIQERNEAKHRRNGPRPR